jgi:hypothetical protein
LINVDYLAGLWGHFGHGGHWAKWVFILHSGCIMPQPRAKRHSIPHHCARVKTVKLNPIAARNCQMATFGAEFARKSNAAPVSARAEIHQPVFGFVPTQLETRLSHQTRFSAPILTTRRFRMKRTFVFVCTLMFVSLLAFNTSAQEMEKKQADKGAKSSNAKASKPATDADLQKCIEDRFANAQSLKDKLPKVTVNGGVATLTGEAKNGGTKGGATRMAKSCGAKEVKNELTVPASTKPAKEKKM